MYEIIRSTVEQEFKAVNQFVVDQLHSNVPLVENIGNYIIDAGGKRMRPVMVLLSARSCGYEGDQHIALAAVIEFIHTATLLHDDVVDMSTLRRGRPTANSEWNNPSSVLVGDFIYSRAFQILVSLGNMEIMQVIADTTNKIAEGEVLQLINKHNTGATEDDYLQVIRSKTAILFQAAALSGAILSRATPEIQCGLKEFGMHVGMAFQLIDDVLDYDGDVREMGKNIGDDLAEGKPTLPLIYAIKHGSERQAEVIIAGLKEGAEGDLEEIISIVRSSGALQYTRDRAQQEIVKAKHCLGDLPDSDFKQALLKMADFATARHS